ncbi:hypothetical protein ACWEQC_46645, partial [Streptomyces shenzhenensis]
MARPKPGRPRCTAADGPPEPFAVQDGFRGEGEAKASRVMGGLAPGREAVRGGADPGPAPGGAPA